LNGWIKLHRELLKKTIWINSTVEQKAVLITIMLLASHIDNEWEWNGKRFRVKPGQFITSTRTLAEAAGVTHRNVRSALLRFEKHEFLTQKATHTGTLITIANWDKYQAISEYPTHDPTQGRHSGDTAVTHDPTTIKNIKKVKECKEVDTDKVPKSKRFIPPTLEEVREYCRQRNSMVDPDHFYEYFEAGSWVDSKGNKVKNWKQKIITWEGKLKDTVKEKATSPRLYGGESGGDKDGDSL